MHAQLNLKSPAYYIEKNLGNKLKEVKKQTINLSSVTKIDRQLLISEQFDQLKRVQ
jgi:hypothetical protein